VADPNKTEPANDTPSLISILKSVGPAIAAATAFEVAAKTYFGSKGVFGLIIPIASAIGLLVASSYLAFAKVPSTEGTSKSGRRFPDPVRAIGLVGLAVFTVLVFFRIWAIRPNSMHGEPYEAGFLCEASSGLPIGDARVVVLSRSGQAMSQSQDLDNRGFFYVDLDRWSFLPESIQVFGKTCKVIAPVAIQSVGKDLCPAARDADNPTSLTIHQWRITCD
jgi:hypothetical protein